MDAERLIVDGVPTTELLYEGKSKQIFATDDPSIVIVHYKDDASAYNGIKRAQITNKGIYNNHISSIIYSLVEKAGVQTHFICRIDDRNQLCRRLQALPLQVVARNRVAGSCASHLGLPVGFKPENIIYEYSYKNDELDDPLINEHHAVALGLATYEDIEYIHTQMVKLNGILTDIFSSISIDLIDFKVEFGRLPNGQLLLSDEISPDTCRIWDVETHESLDKDRFRRDLGRVGEAYKEILVRLQKLDKQ